MSAVNITNVTSLDNPASFLAPFQFEISYECVTPLKDDVECKLIYVGSAEDETYDRVLESVVGPVNVGNYDFLLQADPLDPTKIREEDIIGVTLLHLTCFYLGHEFVWVGYYVQSKLMGKNRSICRSELARPMPKSQSFDFWLYIVFGLGLLG